MSSNWIQRSLGLSFLFGIVFVLRERGAGKARCRAEARRYNGISLRFLFCYAGRSACATGASVRRLTHCREPGDGQPRPAAGTEKQDAGLKPGATTAKRKRPKTALKIKTPRAEPGRKFLRQKVYYNSSPLSRKTSRKNGIGVSR